MLGFWQTEAPSEGHIVRRPLVPGVNDSPAHLAAIAAPDRRYPRLTGIDLLLPYPNTAGSRYLHYDLPIPPPASLPLPSSSSKPGLPACAG
jgi:hypothetical protein